MSIEKEINKAIKKFAFNKNLLEFIDRAKYLKERLKKGESLSVEVDECELDVSGPAHYTIDFIYLELHRKKGKPERAATLDCLGYVTYKMHLFKDYKPLSESQK